MNLVQKAPCESPVEPGLDFNVAIVCAYETSLKVCEVLQLLRRNLREEEGRLLYQLWNMDALAFAGDQDLAADEAAAADMVIVGIHKEHELLQTVGPWINRWISRRPGQPGALVVVLNADLNRSAAVRAAMARLKQAATAVEMDFFVTGAKVGTDGEGISTAARQLVLTHLQEGQNELPGGGKWKRGN